MAYPSTVANIETRIAALAASPTCTVSDLPNDTVRGRKVKAITVVAPGAFVTTHNVVIVAGIHAREWLPPDAVLSFVEKLVAAHDGNTDMRYPSFRDGAVHYRKAEVTLAEVQQFLQTLVITFVPLANPDGRLHNLTRFAAGDRSSQGQMWRGNRNLHRATGCATHGVDLNRNFDWQWELDPYYSAGDEAFILKNTSRDVCDPDPASNKNDFRGRSAASEPETRNVQHLVDTLHPSYFMDVHSAAQMVLVPWDTATDQSGDASKRFGNALLDRTAAAGSGRTATTEVYKEYVPNTVAHPLLRLVDALADKMVANIRDQAGPDPTARTRSTYTKTPIPKLMSGQFGVNAAPVPGSTVGYAFSDPFRSHRPMAFACGLEAGSWDPALGEDGFFPPAGVKYQKIEREVHTAIYTILDHAANHGIPGSGANL